MNEEKQKMVLDYLKMINQNIDKNGEKIERIKREFQHEQQAVNLTNPKRIIQQVNSDAV
jgi:hypothetical protein